MELIDLIRATQKAEKYCPSSKCKVSVKAGKIGILIRWDWESEQGEKLAYTKIFTRSLVDIQFKEAELSMQSIQLAADSVFGVHTA